MTGTPVLTAATIQTRVDGVMDLSSLTQWQDLIIENRATPDVDSVVEVLEVARLQLPPGQEAALSGLLLRLTTLQGEESRIQRDLAGPLDSMARSLRGLELASSGSPFTSRAIARRLREPLATIADPAGKPARDLVNAGRIVGEVLGAVPAVQVFTAAVEHELGAEKYAALRECAERKGVAA